MRTAIPASLNSQTAFFQFGPLVPPDFWARVHFFQDSLCTSNLASIAGFQNGRSQWSDSAFDAGGEFACVGMEISSSDLNLGYHVVEVPVFLRPEFRFLVVRIVCNGVYEGGVGVSVFGRP